MRHFFDAGAGEAVIGAHQNRDDREESGKRSQSRPGDGRGNENWICVLSPAPNNRFIAGLTVSGHL